MVSSQLERRKLNKKLKLIKNTHFSEKWRRWWMQEWEGDCQDVLNLIQGILPACKKTKKTSTNIAEQTLTSKQSKQYDKPGVE